MRIAPGRRSGPPEPLPLPTVEGDGRIPRILHQIHVGGPLPDKFAANVRQLREANPGWEYLFHDDAAAERLLADDYGPAMHALYHSISPLYGAARADLLRYLILYRFGGVYLDLKSVAERPLDEVIAPEDSFVVTQWDNGPGEEHEGFGLLQYLSDVPGGEFLQWFIACAPGHPMMRAVIERVTDILRAYDPIRDGVGRAVIRVTGPVPYTLAIAPLLSRCPHRFVRNHRALGLRYSMASGMEHRELVGTRHYTRARHPIVDQPRSPLMKLVVRAGLEAKAFRRWLLGLG